MRSWIKVVTVDDKDNVVKIEDLAPSIGFAGTLDMKITPHGRLWVLAYGTQWWAGSKDAKLSVINYDADPELVAEDEERSEERRVGKDCGDTQSAAYENSTAKR